MMWNWHDYGQQPALLNDAGDSLSYAQLCIATEQLAELLPERSLVMCVCQAGYGAVVGYAAFLQLQLVPLLLSDRLPSETYQRYMEIYKPDYVWLPSELSIFGCTCVYSSHGYTLMRTRYRREYPLHPKLALLMPTSGSTGSPKMVRLSQQNLLANSQSIIDFLQITPEERAVATLPLQYAYGLSVFHTHLSVGAAVVVTQSSVMQSTFWRMMEEQRVSSLAGVPQLYRMYARLDLFSKHLPHLKTLTQAGGKLTTDLHHAFATYAEQTGRRFFVMYGQTEATARMAYVPVADSLRKLGSIGVAIPGGSLQLMEANSQQGELHASAGRVIESAHVQGELVYRGANVALGYASSGEHLDLDDEWNGVLRTGDLAIRDDEGYYFITGRLRRMIKLDGIRVQLDEIEQLLHEHFADLSCACAGVDERLVIGLTEESAAETVRQFIAERTGIRKMVIEVRVVERLPMNESGKLMYQQLLWGGEV